MRAFSPFATQVLGVAVAASGTLMCGQILARGLGDAPMAWAVAIAVALAGLCAGRLVAIPAGRLPWWGRIVFAVAVLAGIWWAWRMPQPVGSHVWWLAVAESIHYLVLPLFYLGVTLPGHSRRPGLWGLCVGAGLYLFILAPVAPLFYQAMVWQGVFWFYGVGAFVVYVAGVDSLAQTFKGPAPVKPYRTNRPPVYKRFYTNIRRCGLPVAAGILHDMGPACLCAVVGLWASEAYGASGLLWAVFALLYGLLMCLPRHKFTYGIGACSLLIALCLGVWAPPAGGLTLCAGLVVFMGFAWNLAVKPRPVAHPIAPLVGMVLGVFAGFVSVYVGIGLAPGVALCALTLPDGFSWWPLQRVTLRTHLARWGVDGLCIVLVVLAIPLSRYQVQLGHGVRLGAQTVVQGLYFALAIWFLLAALGLHRPRRLGLVACAALLTSFVVPRYDNSFVFAQSGLYGRYVTTFNSKDLRHELRVDEFAPLVARQTMMATRPVDAAAAYPNLALLMAHLPKGPVGVIGLVGAGAAACLHGSGVQTVFYTRNHVLAAIATESGYYTYLKDCGGVVSSTALPQTPTYTALVVDEKVGRTPAPHSLTVEAFKRYFAATGSNGVLLVNTQGVYGNLAAQVIATAQGAGGMVLVPDHAPRDGQTWAVVAQNQQALASFNLPGWHMAARHDTTAWRLWRDGSTNPLSVF